MTELRTLTIPEVADVLQCSVRTVKAEIAADRLIPSKIGTKLDRFTVDDIRDYLKRQKRKPAPAQPVSRRDIPDLLSQSADDAFKACSRK